MRDLIIGKSVAYALDGSAGTIAGTWELDELQDGAIAIVDNEGTLLAAAGDVTKSYYELYVNVGGTIKKSGFPFYKGQTTFNKLVYKAPVAAIKFIGSDGTLGSLSLPATIAAGEEVGISITDLSVPMENIIKLYSYTTVSGDVLTGKTADNIISKLVALINADPNSIVTALAVASATNNTGIKLTSKSAGKDFGIGKISGVLENASIVQFKDIDGVYTVASTTAVSNVTGNGTSGTSGQIEELYKATSSRDGNNQYVLFPDLMFSGVSGIVPGTTYTTYVFKATVPNTDEISVSNNPKIDLVVAVPSGATALIAAIDNFGGKIV